MKKFLYSIACTLLLVISEVASSQETGFAPQLTNQDLSQERANPHIERASLENMALSGAYALYLNKNLYNYGKRIFSNEKGMPLEIDNSNRFQLNSIRITNLILQGKEKALFEVSIEFIVGGRQVYALGLMSEKGELDVLKTNFLTDDPQVKYPHLRNWELIKKGIVRPGMKEAEVILSWGAPLFIKKSKVRNGTYDEWGYPGTYLYFKDGILNTMNDF